VTSLHNAFAVKHHSDTGNRRPGTHEKKEMTGIHERKEKWLPAAGPFSFIDEIPIQLPLYLVSAKRGKISPTVLKADTLLLLDGEVVLKIEVLPHILRRLSFQQVRDGPTDQVEEGFNVEIVSSLRLRNCQHTAQTQSKI
jgi:hypothetical protein